GMRGDGDEPMAEAANIELLERIVADQRRILAEATGRPASETPQCWALYKEVQEYYDRGMRVPDDVMLLLCDDNWGNIRKLPPVDAPPRQGGYGVYYHFDYVGDPRNYKWLNTNPLPRIWEQMHLAYAHGVRRMWIVNVGDIKPMELPISFFLDYAWNPDVWSHEQLEEYATRWATEQFGSEHAAEIGDLLRKYAKYNARRKPELLSAETFSLDSFQEASRVIDEWQSLVERAHGVASKLSPEMDDAYFQLVLHPIEASANLNELYYAAAINHRYAAQGRADADEWGNRVRTLFDRDAELSRRYNEELSGGKWRHMMDQTHIGYRSWQEPPRNEMPLVQLRDPVDDSPSWGVALEGSDAWIRPGAPPATLSAMESYGEETRWIEVFSRSSRQVEFSAEATADWLSVTPGRGIASGTQRLKVEVDWGQLDEGESTGNITVLADGTQSIVVHVVAVKHPVLPDDFEGFVEAHGYLSLAARDATRFVAGSDAEWIVLSDLGRTGAAVMPSPVTAPQQRPGQGAPYLEYAVWLAEDGPIDVATYVSPTQDFTFTGGLEYAISLDEGPIQRVNLHEGPTAPRWSEQVANNINVTTCRLEAKRGVHALKLWMVDPGVVVQKLVLSRRSLPMSYLGPPATPLRNVGHHGGH
ncbi:MAG: glycosyl hydrolase 115 family protein, partial [Planctomycetales bacterium]|nr:glycosyl hydrolase 115 family protein [Planctomycetales bacterium]